jgi:hypothetical protein
MHSNALRTLRHWPAWCNALGSASVSHGASVSGHVVVCGAQSSMQVSDDMKDFFGAMTHLSVPDSMFGPVWQVEDLLDAMQGYDVTGLAAKMKKRLKFGEA